MKTVENSDDFLTGKHRRLLRIASLANISAWIVFIANIALVGSHFLQFQSAYMQNPNTVFQQPNFLAMLGENPVYTANMVLSLLSTFMTGVVYGLGLKGISLGLNMIVETDLNYRDKLEGESHE
ncbi:MAG: hypothetical protein WA821_05420 [Anaerolineales bacterium]